MRNHLLQIWEGFSNLFYPKLCLACNYKSPSSSDIFCLSCIAKMPKTNHHLEKENEFTQRLWGRVKLESGAAMLLYSKKGRTQNLIYNLKYNGQKTVGTTLGKMYGRKLKKIAFYQSIDLIVPVPLHWKKQRIRGYNQSEEFGKGLSETLDIPFIPDALKRTIHSDSQTKKSREERMRNVLAAFETNRPESLKGKHVLLVDDVLTTGATIEACASKILDCEGTKVSALTIAMAQI